MKNAAVLMIIGMLYFSGCKQTLSNENTGQKNKSEVIAIGAIEDVMWKGELFDKIKLDTIRPKEGLYGLGPKDYLNGELLILNGITYLSQALSDSAMVVKKVEAAKAPFFVYSHVDQWQEHRLDANIKNIVDLERFIQEKTAHVKTPFAFKLSGTITSGEIHVQNLPKGTKVSSPQEAHKGQVNFHLENEAVDIIGFFSKAHQGIFTHHDSFLHLHLITEDRSKMGHLDTMDIDEMQLFLPEFLDF